MGFDLHSKKLSAAIILGTLAICALLTAQGATALLATWFLPVEAGPVHLDLSGANLPDLPGSKPPDIRAMLTRNMFDPTTGSLWPPKPAASEEKEEESEKDPSAALSPGEMPPTCSGSLRLVASLYDGSEPGESLVTVRKGSEDPLLYAVGQDVDGKQVESIYPNSVFLRDGSKLCSLCIFEDEKKDADKGKPKVAPVVPKAKPRGVTSDDLDKNIQKVSDTRFTVNRELVNKVLGDQAQLMRSARVVPHEQNGTVVGVKLYGIRRKSILGQLGLQNGDLLRNINGYDMGNPNSALEAYTRLRSADELTVAVTRRGKPVTIEYGIVD